MKKKIISLILVGICGLSLVGCLDNKVQASQTKEFEVLSVEEFGGGYGSLTIVKHKETGKRFIVYRDSNRGGICPLD